MAYCATVLRQNRDRIVEMLAGGSTQDDIAAALRVSRSSVQDFCASCEIRPQPKRRRREQKKVALR